MEKFEDLVRKKGLDGSKIFLCTDNMVSNSISTAGLLRSETINDLAV